MKEALKRLLQAVRLDRDAFVWMDFNDRATADALVFVAITRVLILLGSGWTILGLTTSIGGLEILVTAVLTTLIFWLAYSGVTFAVSRFLLNGDGQYAIYLRIVGFAYPTLLLLVFTRTLGLEPVAAFVLGSVWMIAIVARGISYAADLPMEKAVLASVGGLVGWIILALILGRGLI